MQSRRCSALGPKDELILSHFPVSAVLSSPDGMSFLSFSLMSQPVSFLPHAGFPAAPGLQRTCMLQS